MRLRRMRPSAYPLMQLLLRATALDPDDPGADIEIAASPDTHARRPWEWDVRLTQRPEGISREFDGAGIGYHHLDVRARHGVIDADLRTLEIDRETRLDRDEEELWVLVVETGRLRHGRFELGPGDVLVCEGDDPLTLDLAQADGGRVLLAVVALHRADGRSLRWVP